MDLGVRSAKTNASEPRYTFFVEWFDKQADLIRRCALTLLFSSERGEWFLVRTDRVAFLGCLLSEARRREVHEVPADVLLAG